jgi:hypothetical protein
LGSAQVWQLPLQAVPQQTPSTQNPERHWSLLVQSWPSPNFPQLPLMQRPGAAQSASVVQVIRQLCSSQDDGAHEMATPTMHEPSPSQTLAGTRLSRPSHADSRQMVPAACLAQPPRPLHNPLDPQVEAGSRRHSPCGSAIPEGAGRQSPGLSGRLQLTQGPVQATLQQTPSAQNPDWHC